MAANKSEAQKGLYQDILVDGGANTYNKWADQYDDVLGAIGWAGYKSVVTVWLKYYNEQSLRSSMEAGTKHKMYDAGCGTGLVGQHLITFISSDVFEIYGGDVSADMLKEAHARPDNVYVDLKVDNLKAQLSYEEESFDSIVSAGVFLQAHCGPECLPNIFRVLKKGGYFVLTSRKQFYEETKADWDKAINDYSCELVEITEMPYHSNSAAVVLVIKRN